MSDLIPLDLQLEIIKRVCSDVKYILQLRSVSKEWKSFIDSSEFIAGYGARHTQPHRFILRYKDPDYKENYICFDDNDNTPLTQNNEKFVVVSDLIEQLESPIVVGSSHGLFCFCGYNAVGAKMVVVCNPSIRKSVGIVVPDDGPLKTRTYFAFGVCPVRSDPTVVKISYAKDVSIDTTWHVEIFTLRSKCWNMIPSNNVPRQSIRLDSSFHLSRGRLFDSSTHVAIDRFIYWVAYDNSLPVDDHDFPTVHMLLSFDMISNQFEEVVFPDSLANRIPVTISKLRESLVVLEFDREINENVYGLWMMEHGDDDGIRSFTKLYIINTHESIIGDVLGIRKSGEFIIETRNGDLELATIDVYEPSSQLITNLGIYGRDREDSFFMHPYMEKLLLLDHSDCFIYSSN